ncbi:MAG: GGDEF domain-containing protein [Bacillota bacterium]|nr:GGDEF domain-containing protein [Bacillota bacterium]
MEELFIGKREIFDKLPVGIAKCKSILEESENDFVIQDGNSTLCKMAEKESYEFFNEKFTKAFPKAKESLFDWVRIFNEVAITQKHKTIEQYFDVFEKYLRIEIISIERGYFYLIIEDISLKKNYNDLLLDKQLEIEYLEKELRNKSKKDSLIDVYNQQVMIKKLKFKMENFKNDGESLFCAILNIDRFDDLNYKYTIEFSDTILKEVGEVLKKSIRKIDVLGRIGNDEFLIIMPNITIDIAKIVINKIKSQIRTDIKSLPKGELTLSGAVEEYEGESLEEYYQRLKNSVRKAKKRGRDTVLL